MTSAGEFNNSQSAEARTAQTSVEPNRSDLLDLDADQLSPLPPARGPLSSRTVSLERIPSLKLNGTPRTSAAQPSTVAASPALSAAPSSFRLEDSPPSSPQAAHSPEWLPSQPHESSADRQQPVLQLDTSLDRSAAADKAKPEPQSASVPTPSARYVTVSAILSRSNLYYAPETSDHWDMLRSPEGLPADVDLSHDSKSAEPLSSLRRRRSQRKRPSNGSAIEALGALLLRKDSSGRVASLSFARDDHVDARKGKGQATDLSRHKQSSGSRNGVQAWSSTLSSLSTKGLRLQLPGTKAPKASSSTCSNKGATIAERRARMWHQILTRQGAVVEDSHDGFSKVRSRRVGLSFEVGNVDRKQMPSTLLQLDGYQPHGKNEHRDEDQGIHRVFEGDNSDDDESKDDDFALSARDAISSDPRRLPDTVVLKAGRRPRLTQLSKSEFGIGSAYHDQTLPEAPPSPVAMPGAWQGGSSWRSKPGDGYEEGALLLPPPLLDDNGSDASSFEGLLGVRRMREREKARKHAEKMAARNRPAHKVGPLTALTNFVRAAHAAETSAKRARGDRRFGPAPAFFRSLTEPQQPSRARSTSLGSTSRTNTRSPTAISNGGPDKEQSGTPRTDGASMALPALQTSLAAAAVTPSASDPEARDSPAIASASPFMSPSLRRAALSRRESRTNSIDTAGRQLNTVFEFEPLDPSKIPDDELASLDLPPISSPLLRPSSRSSNRTGALRDFPTSPRLLPVQLSVPPSPFTPLAIDHRDPRSSIGVTASNHTDYLSARNLRSATRTPKLAPTMLSLPPSPWTPYQDAAAMNAAPMVHLHLNSSSSSLRLPPGTPRLVPTHIEILPSPFPASASSRRGSLTYDSPQSLHAANLTRSPLTGPAAEFTTFAASRESHAANTHAQAEADIPDSTAQSKLSPEVAHVQEARTRGGLRHTPSSLLVQTQSAQPSDAVTNSDGIREDATTPPTNDEGASDEVRRKSSSSRRRRSSATQSTIHVDSSGRQRSFILWFFIGDLGLRSKNKSSSQDQTHLEVDYGGVVAFFTHSFAFLVFVAAHLVDLGCSTYERVSLVLWFLRWMVYNLTGRTVLAQCVIEAYGFIQAEWATVAIEDHEEKGSKHKPDQHGGRKPRGLSRFQVLRGILELYCLHSVTRDRYISEGAGLTQLDGWRKPSSKTNNVKIPKLRGSDRLDIGNERAASRAALANERPSGSHQQEWDAQQKDDDPGNTTAISNGNGADWTLPQDEQASGIGPQSSSHTDDTEDNDNNDDDDNGDNHDEDEEEEDSSDDEMIVTNRGDDILEFAKTPRLDAARPGQASSGYFVRAYDLMTSPQFGASRPDSVKRDLRPFKESNRDLVRTIKWCGRLAISAYGLHVHIVDLPPTFTPSGERFSRQTFAYLSRLNADDVLHADIQTLDADADYSPTFYVIRDYVRKVVCVAVRGTQSFSDIIVDLDLQTEEIELPQVQPTPGEEFRCHAGIWRAAKALVSPQSKLFATLRQALAENEGFGVMFCGHSLGGAIASAAVLLLAEYLVSDVGEADAGTWVTNKSCGLPARRPIRAVSFASPVTMTANLAARAALGSVPLVTTVVLGSDIIPRAGHGQVRELRRVLGALARVRRRHAMASSEGQDDARVHIVRSYWDWRSISMAQDADEVMLHRKKRIEEQLWSLRREVESDLYAAIKARLDAKSTPGARIPPSPWVGPQQRDQAPLHALSTRRQELDTATLRSEASQGGPLIPPGRCIWINEKQVYQVESPLAFFSLPELRSDMFAAHFPAAYEEAILALKA